MVAASVVAALYAGSTAMTLCLRCGERRGRLEDAIDVERLVGRVERRLGEERGRHRMRLGSAGDRTSIRAGTGERLFPVPHSRCGTSSPCFSMISGCASSSAAGPSATSLPPSSTSTRGHTSSTRSRSCVAISFVPGSVRISAISSRRPRGSRNAERFVEQQHRRAHRQHARQRRAPLVAAGELKRHALAGLRRKPDCRERLERPRCGLVRASARGSAGRTRRRRARSG